VISPVVDVRVVIVVAAIVPPSTLSPLIWSSASVRVPAETLSVLPDPTVISLVAIVVPSIFPPLISVVVRIESPIVILPDESSIVAAEVPSLALRLVTSIFVVSTVVALTFVISPVVDVRVVIVVVAIVPPSTLSPLIWSSASVRVPAETSIVPPLITGVISVLFVNV